jgi:hypothetical protein
MATQLKNPVPKGRYWADIIDTNLHMGARLQFLSWLVRNDKKVKVVKVEHFGRVEWGADRDWYLFDVLEPVVWEKGKGFGLPTIVQSADHPTAAPVTQSADTAPPHPKIPTISEQLSDMFSGSSTALWVLAGVWLMSKMGDR